MSAKRMAQVLCIMTLVCGFVYGQSTTGNLLGTVTDASGAAVPSVQVELKKLPQQNLWGDSGSGSRPKL
jgi:hypothetical protein